jgi:hypothetical protein
MPLERLLHKEDEIGSYFNVFFLPIIQKGSRKNRKRKKNKEMREMLLCAYFFKKMVFVLYFRILAFRWEFVA